MTSARAVSESPCGSSPSSAEVVGETSGNAADDPRLRAVGQLKAMRLVSTDDYSRGWRDCVDYAIAALFPLPTPRYTARFPLDDVSRGLRELAGTVQLDLSDACHCGKRVCTGCSR